MTKEESQIWWGKVLDQIKEGNRVLVLESELVEYFRLNYDPMKGTHMEAAREWLKRSEPDHRISWAYVFKHETLPPHYLLEKSKRLN